MSAGLAEALMEDAVSGASHVRRLRFLSSKYNLDTDAWVSFSEDKLDNPPTAEEEIIDIPVPQDWEGLEGPDDVERQVVV